MPITYISSQQILNLDQLPEQQANSCLFIDDHIGSGGIENHETLNHLKYLLTNAPKDYKIILEYVEFNNISGKNIMCLPVWALYSAYEIAKIIPYNCPSLLGKAQIIKKSTYNFSINKARDNRSHLLKTLSKKKYYSSTYSLCWHQGIGDFKPRYWGDSIPDGQRFIKNNTNENNKNSYVYNAFLRKHVFEPSYISIITEPEWYEPNTFITEKTLFAFEAQTIPIWYGGYNIPHHLKDIGFDVFDDIVDHSYQHLEDPYQRMTEAIERNRVLFENIDFLKEFYKNNKHRFELNRQRVRENTLTRFIDRELDRFDHWPQSLKQEIRNLYKTQWPL